MNKRLSDVMEQRIVSFMIYEAGKQTLSGGYSFSQDEICNEFNVSSEWLNNHEENILTLLNKSPHVLEAYMDTDIDDPTEIFFELSMSSDWCCSFCDLAKERNRYNCVGCELWLDEMEDEDEEDE